MIKSVKELTKSETKTDYKRDIVNCSNLGARLSACGFDITKFWNQVPQNGFKQFGNEAEKIKLKV